VKPSEVRLKFGEEQAQYAWKFNDKSLVPLFDKHLSKHSVGAYMQLHREAGKGFCAVDPKDIAKVFHDLHNVCIGISGRTLTELGHSSTGYCRATLASGD
jgi:hypothetical protein